MKKEYLAPAAEIAEFEPVEAILVSQLPSESGNEMPILTRKIVTNELNGDPNLDPEDQLVDPTEDAFY